MKRIAALVLILAAACAPDSVDPLTSDGGDAAIAASEAVGIAGDAALLGAGIAIDRPLMMGIGGFSCDSTPEITTATVCGRDYPATAHLEWTSCAGQGSGTSSGVVDLTQTIVADPPDCGTTTTITGTLAADFDVTRTRPNAGGVHLDGVSSSTAVHTQASQTATISGTVDVTQERLDTAGIPVRTIDLDGTFSVAFDESGTVPTRTLDADLTAVLVNESTTLEIDVVDVVRVPPSTCPYPISGSVQATKTVNGASTTHLLVYGPNCGDATLDGQPIDLSQAHP